ncbi:MAG: radical SAM family heme chaperone HemW [Armatimonadetes bacterium]|nr:radical SAM family heme chaperone HemW [Armatimonadota bacterium]
MRVGLYIHVPFCLRKCHYCDFYSLPAGPAPEHAYAFVAAVEREMASAAARHAALGPLSAATLFLGGGTPSLLTPAQLGRLLAAARTHFLLAPDAEITIEANPGTLDAEKARAVRDLGVNRVSVGVQSFDDPLLRRLGRAHAAARGIEAIGHLRAAGLENISLDLMFALPGQSLASWRETLRRAIALAPEHVSAYGLTVEPGTPFADWERQGRLSRPDEELEAAMLEEGIAILTAAGYEHYEISNFARPGRQCAHNRTYWRNEPYLGFGPSAASYSGGARSVNVRSLSRYLAAIAAGESPVETVEAATRELEMGETMMVGLRLLEGVTQARFRERFGVPLQEAYADPIRRLTAAGLVTCDEHRLALTRRGLLLASNVMAEFLR